MAFNQTLYAQNTIYIESSFLKKKTPVLIHTPNNYEPSKKYPLVFMLHGYSENYKQWSEISDLNKLANQYQMILICPEAYVSYYLDSPELADSQYESFFFNELIPEVENNYHVDHQNIFITGLSMGGYGALSLFIKHPDYFNTAASTSGALEFDYENFKNISLQFFDSERMNNDLKRILGDPQQTDWQQYSISTLLKQNAHFKKGFLLDCGLQDPLLDNTLQIKELALVKKLPIKFSIQPGEHNAAYWTTSIEYHFVYFNQHLKKG
ncbi:alpha/beta hydrolase [Chondrinema litorale]|uniref:alpha/beta hydrolase n=1 Tax=Chondrinema litorale TaxID=2994555 RepID=UPI0025427B5E|nr:alpha/beta hydrolase-fold protein [Chondrinema litorale]UZR98380.1 alpha/beta hydrolase-fold protein [Chondrinema litorale]